MDEDATRGADQRPDARERAEAAARDAEATVAAFRREFEQEVERAQREPAVQQEYVRQNNVMYGGLIGVATLFVQPFLTAPPTTLPARICVIALSVAIPLLAMLLLLNQQETFRRRLVSSPAVQVARSLAMLAACIGLAAGFWRISWVAGVAFLGSGLVGVGVHSSGYTWLEYGSVARLRARLKKAGAGSEPEPKPGSRSGSEPPP